MTKYIPNGVYTHAETGLAYLVLGRLKEKWLDSHRYTFDMADYDDRYKNSFALDQCIAPSQLAVWSN